MEKYGDEVPFLVAQNGPLNGQRWPLRTALVLGREPDCDIVIADRQVSRHHARLSIDQHGIVLEDLGSKNGTHNNGQKIEMATMLQDGDVIQIALAQQFVFLSSDSTIPLENQPAEARDHLAGGVHSVPIPPEMSRLRLEKRSRRVWIAMPAGEQSIDEKEIIPPLSVSQFKLLEVLYDNQGRVVSRPDLVSAIWGEGQAFEISEQALDALVRRLRDRIARIDATHEYVVTVRGHGLRLDNPLL
ncbi:MAG: FHA domain-containing protein [Anaerolineales bacterium]|nr:FHA domain-containing protein [Anaerolineales bacterium]